MELASDWDWRAHYAQIKARVAPNAVVRTPIVRRSAASKGRTIYAKAIGPRPKKKKHLAQNARPDLARRIYKFPIQMSFLSKGRTRYFYPIGPKAPGCLPSADGKSKIPRQIIAEEIKISGLTWEQYLTRTRAHHYATARRRLYWRLYRETNLSLPRVGALVKRDHSTVLHAVRRHEEITKGVAQ